MSEIKNQLIDVNLNRLSEGIKVLEDLIRFYFRDYQTLQRIRNLKQSLWQKFSAIRKQAISSRKSEKDLGRKRSFDIHKRGNMADILIVNFKRCQESSRVLEELFKTINSRYAGFLKDLRFALYDLEKELFNQIKIEFNPKLYVILDIASVGRKHLTKITQACLNGSATMIQLREAKDTTIRQWLSDAHQIQKPLSGSTVKFIINNRVDVALAINSDGVHLGKENMPAAEARKLLGDDKIIGITVRNIKQAQQAEKQGADYIGVGAVFASPTKPSAPVVGIKTLKRVVKSIKIPVVAVGGINQHNIRAVIQAKIAGVAVVSSVFKGVDFTKPSFKKKIIHNLKQLSKNINL